MQEAERESGNEAQGTQLCSSNLLLADHVTRYGLKNKLFNIQLTL